VTRRRLFAQGAGFVEKFGAAACARACAVALACDDDDDDDDEREDRRDRGPIPFAIGLFARRSSPRPWAIQLVACLDPSTARLISLAPASTSPQGLTGAHASPPADRAAQIVPAQQSVAIGSHSSPAPAQRAGGGVTGAPSTTQTVAPVGPAQAPAQQSSAALQRAPRGAH
jgi:hypothetical protein